MKISTIDIIQSVPINLFVSQNGDELVRFLADMDIDCDGSGGNPDHDQYFQADTTLHYDGVALDAYHEPFVVVEPIICEKTHGKVLGSLCLVENTFTGELAFGVVGDIGPTFKVGEGSPALAKQISVNPNPVTGGENRRIIRYSIFVGTPANINGRQYALQGYRERVQTLAV